MDITKNTRVVLPLTLVLSAVLGVGSATATIGVWKATMENRVEANEENIINNRHDIDQIGLKMNEQDVILAEIRTDLKWIRAAMEDNR